LDGVQFVFVLIFSSSNSWG